MSLFASQKSRLLTYAIVCLQSLSLTLATSHSQTFDVGSLHSTVIPTENRCVKLYGAGGMGLDAYQSGFFISSEGHVLTVWSTVLDVAEIVVVTSDGRRLMAEVQGMDPNLEIAVLKTDQPSAEFFSLADSAQASVGERVLAISNLFGIAAGGERSSAQKGVVMTITELKARRGNFSSVYQGPAMIIDAMTNNPGAAGGALINLNGQLLGILGKELRDTNANIWINYAVPVAQIKSSVASILEGKTIAKSLAGRRPADRPLTLAEIGLGLIPNVLSRTPAYIDLVEPQSRAALAGLQIDDLILFLNSQRIVSQAALLEELKHIDRADRIQLMIQRGNELKEVTLGP